MKKLFLFLLFWQVCGSLRLWATDPDTVGYRHFRIGGYGEMVANFQDYGLNRYALPSGSSKIAHNTIGIPRFVIAMDYKLSRKWLLGAEIEFEAGGTGMAYELEKGSGNENLEYETEMEKGGEVALEQFHITRLITPAFNIRAGHIIVPVGQINQHHEPIHFFTTSRPESQTTFIPSTWHETGIEFFGSFGKGLAQFDYQAMVVAGLNPSGFGLYNWVKGGKQGLFETDNFTSPAYVVRLHYTGLPNLRLGGSLYFNPKANKNCDKLVTFDGIGDINISIFSLDASYASRWITARANYLYGNLPHSVEIAAANKNYTNKSPYSRKSPIAKNVLSYSLEAGIHLNPLLTTIKHFPHITPFFHYEYCNPQEKGEKGSIMEKRCQVSRWTAGINWLALPNLVVKADYTTRQIGTAHPFKRGKYNSENEFSVGIAYVGWFFKD